MLKKLSFLLLLIIVTSCDNSADQYTIQGKLRGAVADGTKVFLKTTDSLSSRLVDVDSTAFIDGKFSFTGTIAIPQIHYFVFEGIRGNTPVIVEKGTIGFDAHRDSLESPVLKGTLQNRLFMKYMEQSIKFGERSRSMNQEFTKAREENDTVLLQSLKNEFLTLRAKAKEFEKSFVTTNPDALISALVLERTLKNNLISGEDGRSMYEKFTKEIKESRPGINIKKQLDAQTTIPVDSSPAPASEKP